MSVRFTYSAVGGTREPEGAPAGFRAVDGRARIGTGDERFRRAAESTMRWGVQRGSGIRVRAPERPLRAGDDVTMRVALWPRDVPCRVVYVVDEPDRVGFAYGTLPGHPERGEELFLVERDPNGSVWLRVRAFSRPAGILFWIGYPLARWMQEIYTRRYLRALR